MKKLTIRWKFILNSFGVLLTAVILISIVISFLLKQDLERETAEFKKHEIERTKADLKNYVDIAYNIVIEAGSAAKRGEMTVEKAKQMAIQQIEKLRYDSGIGYFWINDSQLPFPRMIMHPTVPALNGTILKDAKYNCAMGKDQNLFVAMVEVTADDGEGYVDYLWPKPTKEGLTTDQPKLSYVRWYKPFDWIIGTGKYIDDIDQEVAKKHAQTGELINGLILTIFLTCFIIIILAIIPIFYLSKRLVAPILACIDYAGDVERGNLSGVVDYQRRDETGRLINSLNKMVATIRNILSNVYQHSALVVLASNKLASTSENMTLTSTEVREKTETVAAAAERASANLFSVSQSIESLGQRAGSISRNTNSMAENINSVASAAEEMANSFQEVALHCAKAQNISDVSLKKSDDAAYKINDLSQASENIGGVIKLIEQITEQTKLLALNATIEAARAGEAGKGFSVVANEVKELAGQTAKATEGISKRIQDIQKQIHEAVQMVQDISINNQELNDINTSIAITAEQQSVTTNDIAKSVANAAKGAADISEEISDVSATIHDHINPNIKEAANKVSDVSTSIQEVYHGVSKNYGAAQGNVAFARELANAAEELRTSFSEFNFGYRKFDIGMIKAAHLAWRLHLEAMLHKGFTLSLDEIPDHTQCDFGKWLATPEAQELKALKVYPEMIRLHEKIHKLAYQIADLYHNGKQEEATAYMEEFKKTSKELFASLDELYTG